MVQRRIPLTIYRPAKAGVHSFAIMGACEAAARSVLISAFPILLYRALQDAKLVSQYYLYIGLSSLLIALFVPWFSGFIRRRYLYTIGVLLMICGNVAGASGVPDMIIIALLANTVALVIMTVCFNAYVMDYIERTSMGKNESLRLLYSGISWSVGPFLGVWLMDVSPAAPFILSIVACICLLSFFWYLRLGDGKVIVKAKKSAANPLAYIPRFFAQPTLVSGWTFSVFRSIGWAIYIVYLPIYAVENGLSDKLGGVGLSISNSFLFLSTFILRFVQSGTVKRAIITGFIGSGALYVSALFFAGFPMVLVVLLILSTLFLVLLDICAGLPFLMSVKPSERTEMAAVYSTFRDVSAVVSPAMAWVVLIFLPIQYVFLVTGLCLFGCTIIAMRIHPRLGKRRAEKPTV